MTIRYKSLYFDSTFCENGFYRENPEFRTVEGFQLGESYCTLCVAPSFGTSTNCLNAPCRYTAYDLTISGVTIGFGGSNNSTTAPNGTWRLYSSDVKPVPYYTGCYWTSNVIFINFCKSPLLPGGCTPYTACPTATGFMYWYGVVNPTLNRFEVSLVQDGIGGASCPGYGVVFDRVNYSLGVDCPAPGSYGYQSPVGRGIISVPTGYDPAGSTATLTAVV